MNIDDVINDFAGVESDLPKASMQWAVDNWDIALPRFQELMERYADGADRSDHATDALFFCIHLIGQKHAAPAFPTLCRLIGDADVGNAVLGDAITETLTGILISAYDGDASLLQGLVESPGADEFVRGAALEAMAYLCARGAIGHDAMHAYMARLIEDMQPRGESFVWSAWATSAANLGYADFASEVGVLCSRGFIARWDMNLDDFNDRLQIALADPERQAGFTSDRIGPFEDAIGVLSGWDGFSEEARTDKARRLAEAAAGWLPSPFDEPYVNVHRDVGRNDPCPCGSGKKFKKCCLPA
jgi:uncharacterized protein